MNWVALVLIAFLCGSLPFSVWLGRLFLGLDVRNFGDGNPGATNAFRSGSKVVGLMSLLRGLPMVLIAMAPILGHVFSPFLGFKGGKALATALGVWIGLTIWKASIPAVIGILLGIALITPTGWAVMLAMCTILLGLLLWIPDPLLLQVWLGESLILAWTHHLDLAQSPHLRGWLTKWFSRHKE
jgi:glycerol-3-phosphate acyltransferase PlsY